MYDSTVTVSLTLASQVGIRSAVVAKMLWTALDSMQSTHTSSSDFLKARDIGLGLGLGLGSGSGLGLQSGSELGSGLGSGLGLGLDSSANFLQVGIERSEGVQK